MSRSQPVAALTLAGILAALLLAAGSAQTSSPANATLPAGAAQAKATTACTECHEAQIIVQQRLSKPAWTKEVDKMVKWGALVDTNDRDALIDYLSSNFSPDQPPYQPPRTTGQVPQTARGKNASH